MAKGAHGGRPSSWLAVATMITGFIVGGIALTIGPTWPMFWAGVVVAGVGGLVALAGDIFSDVVIDDARDMPEGIGQRQVSGRDTPTVSEPGQEAPHG